MKKKKKKKRYIIVQVKPVDVSERRKIVVETTIDEASSRMDLIERYRKNIGIDAESAKKTYREQYLCRSSSPHTVSYIPIRNALIQSVKGVETPISKEHRTVHTTTAMEKRP